MRALVYVFAGVAAAWLSGCAGPRACELGCVSACIVERSGFDLGPGACPGELVWPNGASLSDGLAEDEAVLIALWNNAAFLQQLTELGIARGNLVQAGLLPNPEFVYFFPASDKPFKYALDLPLEALWLRPIRVAAAAREADRVGDQLSQSALDLIRNVRQAYADLLLALGRLAVAEEGAALAERVAQLAAARQEAGDVSVQEAALTRIESLRFRQEAVRLAYDIAQAEERLRNLLGIGLDRTPLMPAGVLPPPRIDIDPQELAGSALLTRPDLLAAEQGVLAADERVRLARSDWFRLLGILDATSGTRTGHEFSSAFRVTLPVFHFNGGNIARAEAELERAIRQRQTIHDQIVMEVHQAYQRYAQARAELEMLEQRVRPEVETAIARSERAYHEGNVPYLVVLVSTRQLLDTRLRQEVLRADLRRSWAELERSAARRLAEPVVPGAVELLPEATLVRPLPEGTTP